MANKPVDWDVLEPWINERRNAMLWQLAKPGIDQRDADLLRGRVQMLSEIMNMATGRPVQILPNLY